MNNTKVYLISPELFNELQSKEENLKQSIRAEAIELKESGLIKNEELYVTEQFIVQRQESQESIAEISNLSIMDVLDNTVSKKQELISEKKAIIRKTKEKIADKDSK